MGRIIYLFLISLMLSASMPLQGQGKFDRTYLEIGADFESSQILSGEEITRRYSSLNPGDSLSTTIEGVVSTVCQQKGCWMRLDLEGDQEVMVRFKDYAFFVPKDIEGKKVILNGKAFVSELSVEEQRHYAEDEGQPQEKIASITSPERTLSFLAHGVKIEQEP